MVNTLGEKKSRKQRSDKKHSMRPTISHALNERLNRLSYITDTPMKDVAETVCKMTLITTPIIESLVPYFKREYWSNACVMYPGHFDNQHYPVKRESGRIRTTIRFMPKDYDQIERLAY
ncbi:MAG: hypothetical protein K0Q87_1587, partial [Neobacillus sp.]|nr:hypothetical protein [Neobacillus sp.]